MKLFLTLLSVIMPYGLCKKEKPLSVRDKNSNRKHLKYVSFERV